MQQPQTFAYPVSPYAGFWRRVVAYLIDAVVIGIPFGIIGGILGALAVASNPGALNGSGDATATIGAFAGPRIVLDIFGAVAGWLYFGLLESSSYQATLGKMVMGIVVTDLNGQRISFGRATGRYFAKIVSALICWIGFIMVAFTQRKQGLHDMMASTLVTRKGFVPQAAAPYGPYPSQPSAYQPPPSSYPPPPPAPPAGNYPPPPPPPGQ